MSATEPSSKSGGQKSRREPGKKATSCQCSNSDPAARRGTNGMRSDWTGVDLIKCRVFIFTIQDLELWIIATYEIIRFVSSIVTSLHGVSRASYFFFLPLPPALAPPFLFLAGSGWGVTTSGASHSSKDERSSFSSTKKATFPNPQATSKVSFPSRSSTCAGLADDFFPLGPYPSSWYPAVPHVIADVSDAIAKVPLPQAMLRMSQPEISKRGLGYMMVSPVALGLPQM
mmetsp:Transcript_13557/g.34981  ORF Transcript_13557/g.34981 Transcript_13557/m.34981 type:complete len:229 (-) Transcript_13557:789-1475(-)